MACLNCRHWDENHSREGGRECLVPGCYCTALRSRIRKMLPASGSSPTSGSARQRQRDAECLGTGYGVPLEQAYELLRTVPLPELLDQLGET